MKCDILIFDGRHLLWRTSDAFRDLHTEINGDTIGTGGMYGFLTVGARIHQKYGGASIVAWEGESNFRFDLYPEYKQKDAPDDDTLELIRDMNHQELRLKAVLRAMGVRQYMADHCEADDVIGTIAKKASAQGKTVVIYSGDSDLRQLVDDNVTCVSPGYRSSKDSIYDAAAVEDKHGVPPALLPDLKALSGDSSDNIPGIRGIGPKTAVKAIQACGDVEGVIKAAQGRGEWPIAERFKATVAAEADTIRLFKKLTTIQTSAGVLPIPPKRSQATLTQHFLAYKFRSLMAPLELKQLMGMAG